MIILGHKRSSTPLIRRCRRHDHARADDRHRVARRVVENRRSARPRNPVGHVAHDCATLSCRRRRFAQVRTCHAEQASLLRRRRREREARARRGAPTVSLDRWPCRRKRSLRTRSSTSVLRRVESTRRARSPWLSVSRSRQWQSHTARRDTASGFCQGGAIASICARVEIRPVSILEHYVWSGGARRHASGTGLCP